MTMPVQSLRLRPLGCIIALVLSACSTPQTPPPSTDQVRQHADKAFQRLQTQEKPQDRPDLLSQSPSPGLPEQSAAPAPSTKGAIQIPLPEIQQSDGGDVRVVGYGSLAKGLYLCHHSADLAARVELSKLIRVKVTERSTDRIRERTGKEAEQDIEIVREGLVNEMLSGVRIVERNVDQDAGTCSSTAVIPKKNLSPTAIPGHDATISPPR